jgi:hypothetical protein
MSDNWTNNKNLIWSIIDENIINENKLNKFEIEIKNIFENIYNDFNKYKYDYNDYPEINKQILQLVNDNVNKLIDSSVKQEITNITSELDNINNENDQNNQNDQHNMNKALTIEDLRKQREIETMKKYNEVKNNFQTYNKNNKPKDIDFSDKTKQPEESIDDLLKKEMQKRDYILQDIYKKQPQNNIQSSDIAENNPDSNSDNDLKKNVSFDDFQNSIIKDTQNNNTLHIKDEEISLNNDIIDLKKSSNSLKKIKSILKNKQDSIENNSIENNSIENNSIQNNFNNSYEKEKKNTNSQEDLKELLININNKIDKIDNFMINKFNEIDEKMNSLVRYFNLEKNENTKLKINIPSHYLT